MTASLTLAPGVAMQVINEVSPSTAEVATQGLALSPPCSRRSFLAAMTGAAAALWSQPALSRDYGPGAAPVRYPDPDIVSLDKRFDAYKLGNTPIQRLYHSPEMLW